MFLKVKDLVRVRDGRILQQSSIHASPAIHMKAVSRNIAKFQPSDEVFAGSIEYGYGAFAEYKLVPENALALKRDRMTLLIGGQP
jgi:hypothetical protein